MRSHATQQLDHAGLSAFVDPIRLSGSGRSLLVHGAVDSTDHPVISAVIERFQTLDSAVVVDVSADAPGIQPLQSIALSAIDLLSANAASHARQLVRRAFAADSPGAVTLLDTGRRSHRLEDVRAALMVAAAERPLLIVLRDLEHAQPELVGALRFLTAPPADGIAALGHAPKPSWLFTLQAAEHDPCAARDELLANSTVISHAVAPLDADGLSALMGEPALIARLGDLTDFRGDRLRQLVALLPDDVSELATLRLDALSVEAQAVLRWASNLGQPVSAPTLTELSGESRLVVERLVGTGILTRANGQLTVASDWRPAIRSTVDGLTEAEHRRCADALNERTDSDSVLARAEHRRLGGQHDAFRADLLATVDSLCSAGRLERAAAVCDRAPADDLQVTRRRVWIDIRRGDLVSALERCQQLAGADSTLDLRAAHLLRLTGDLRAAEEALCALLTQDLSSELRTLASLELATTRLRRGDLDGAASACAASESGDTAGADSEFTAGFDNVRGHIAYRRGDWIAAAAAYSRAACGTSDSRLRGAALHNLGLVALARGDHRAAVDQLQAALAEINIGGDHVQAAGAMHNLGIAQEHLHRYSLAAEQFRNSIDTLQRMGERSRLANAISSLADLHLTLGETWRAIKLLALVKELAEEGGQHAVSAIAQRRLARAELMDGHAERAAPLEKQAREQLEILGHDAEVDKCWLVAGQIALALGDTNGVRRALAEIRQSDDNELRGRSLLVDAQLNATSNRSVASELALEAVHIFRDIDVRDGLVEALAIAALVGSGDAALALKTQAQETFAALSMRVPAEQRVAFQRTPAGRALERLQAPCEHETTVLVVQSAAKANSFHRLVGTCPQMVRVFDMTRRAAASSAPILILGESGTGKELVAEAIHAESPRASGPFIRVNAAAFVDSLLESELFGHERGAFTGAHARRAGAFELAHRGTLFLDEIGDITPRTQVALLRALQQGEIRRVGGTSAIPVDVRVVCATNHNLEQQVECGAFRLDLYYRIRGITLELPALRDRGDDLLTIAQHLLTTIDPLSPGLTDDAVTLLRSHPWPGNVRELENILQTAHFFAQGQPITAATLRQSTVLGRAPTSRVDDASAEPLPVGFDLKAAQRELEIASIIRALKQTTGNITHAADLLGFKRPRLSQKIKEYELRSYLGTSS